MNNTLKTAAIALALVAPALHQADAESKSMSTPLLIAGGGASGVTAGVAASRLGAKALIVESTPWVGGMLTSAGVSAIDGNSNLPAGLWGEFRDSLVAHYGSREALRTGWVSDVQFEPSVGEHILRNMILSQPGLSLVNGYSPVSVTRQGQRWLTLFTDAAGDTLAVTSDLLIDATELGDIAHMAGVEWDMGMESKAMTGEEVAPDSANSIIQDLTYVAVLKDYGRDVTIPCPDGYDPQEFACTAWNPICVTPKEPDRMWPADKMITYGALPNGKYMINWPIEGNDFYVNIIPLSPSQRDKALEAAKNYTLCYLYFLQTQLGFNTLGLADDEFPTDDRLPMIPYHRESRRIHGLVRYTVTDMTDPFRNNLYLTSVAVGDYPVDQHHKRYTGEESLPDLHFHPVPSFGLPMATLLPVGAYSLIVAEKSISVSNIANGATRLQPVVLQIGQAAGTIAALALQKGVTPAQVPVRDVQQSILAQGGYLMPYLDCEPGSPMFATLQRIGASGVLRGESRRVGWTNETRIHPDSLLTHGDLRLIANLYGVAIPARDESDKVYRRDIESLLLNIASSPAAPAIDLSQAYSKATSALSAAGLKMPSFDSPITRGAYAVVIDALLDPFGSIPIDHHGNPIGK